MEDLLNLIKDDVFKLHNIHVNDTFDKKEKDIMSSCLFAMEDNIDLLLNIESRIVDISGNSYTTTLSSTKIQSLIESYNSVYGDDLYEDYFDNFVKVLGLNKQLTPIENIEKFEL